MSLRGLRHLAEFLLCRILLSLIQAVSLETCQTAIRVMAWVACDVLRIRGRIVEENLRHAFPQLDPAQRHKLAREMWEHLLWMCCETALVLRKIHETNWREHVDVYHMRELLHHAFSKRPVVSVAGHFGNFEICGYMAGFFGIRTYTVARTLENPYLDRLVFRFRQVMGQRILPKIGSATQADEVLQSGGMLVLLGDQHAGKIGCLAEFMGRPVSCHKALALFSLINRAPMLVVNCTRSGGPMHFEMGLDGVVDPLDDPPEAAGVAELTQWYNDVLEACIRRHPEQYWWLHDRWKDISQYRRLRKKQAA